MATNSIFVAVFSCMNGLTALQSSPKTIGAPTTSMRFSRSGYAHSRSLNNSRLVRGSVCCRPRVRVRDRVSLQRGGQHLAQRRHLFRVRVRVRVRVRNRVRVRVRVR